MNFSLFTPSIQYSRIICEPTYFFFLWMKSFYLFDCKFLEKISKRNFKNIIIWLYVNVYSLGNTLRTIEQIIFSFNYALIYHRYEI